MKQTFYPSIEEAIFVHEKLISRFGGQPGIRDKGILVSALARPQSGYYDSLSLQAAALFESLLLNHCFIDGNKRIAFTLTSVFLKLNGYKLSVDPKEAEDFIVTKIIAEKIDLELIAIWLEKHIK